METIDSRSESPFSKSKANGQSPDTSETEGSTAEQTNITRKSLRNRQKIELNGDKELNGNENHGEEITKAHQTENGIDKENGHDNSSRIEVEDGKDDLQKSNCEGNNITTEAPVEENKVDTTEEENGCSTTSETESSAKKDVSLSELDKNEPEVVTNGNHEENINGETNDCSNSSMGEHEPLEESLTAEESSQNGINGSDKGSLYEDANGDKASASPDTATGKDGYFTHKFSNLLGKWTPSSTAKEHKEDSEISPFNLSLPSDGVILNHPYLSKVSGRRGIRDKGDATFSVKDEMKTPPNSESTLNDSFRVRTNPPRLNSSELRENTTLRKFSGKRCLIASDDPEDAEDALYLTTTKRRKVDDKEESGLLGSILWSPFKKKSLENKNMANTESKLSRFLSPFWFWKKTTAGK